MSPTHISLTHERFAILISTWQNNRKFVMLHVHKNMLTNCNSLEEKQERVGWLYMNRIDAMSCTIDYKWSVLPIEVFENSGFKFEGDIIDIS